MNFKYSFIFLSFLLLFFSSAYAGFTQNSDSLGLVIMQAENYDTLRAGTIGDNWGDSTAYSGYYGSGYMQVDSVSVYNPSTKAQSDAPALYYNITFVDTGEFYIWARKYFIDGSNDSFYYGLDDSIATASDMVPHGAYGVWEWVMGPTTIHVPTTGVHKLGIYLRERKSAVDEIVLTSSATFDPNTDLKTVAFVYDGSLIDNATGESPDQPTMDLLSSKGYSLLAVNSNDLSSESQATINSLNNADLVIAGRTIYSGQVQGANKDIWNGIKAPLMITSVYDVRSNRLGWFNSTSLGKDENTGDTLKAKVMLPNDDVFSDVTLTDSVMSWAVSPYETISVADAGNGTTVVKSEDGSIMLMARFDPWTEFYDGAGAYAAGYRTYMGNGYDGGGAAPWNYLSSFTDAAQSVFLNEVARMVNLPAPPPKPAGLGKTIAFISLPSKIDPATNENADQPFIDDLKAESYTVNTYYSKSLAADTALVDTLNSADLVIIGRSGSSSDFGNTNIADRIAWNAIKSPLLNLHLWTARSSRLNWLPTGTTTQDNNVDDTISAKIEVPDDPVFADATIAADSTMDWVISPYDFMETTDGGNGTVLAREATSSNVLFVRWDPWKEFYSGAGDMPAGYRTLIGNGNDAAGSINYYNFTDEAKQVYLNEVARMASLGKVERPVKKVAYVTNADKQADLVEGTAPVNDDPIIRMLNADDNFKVDVLAVAPDSSVDLSGYDVVVAQESFNSSSAIFMPGGSLGFASIPVPFLYNKVYAMRDGRGFQGGATGSGSEIEGTYTIDVDPANQGNDLFKGLTFENNQLTLLTVGADDNGGTTRTKGLNYATDVVISDTTTLLGMETGAPSNATVCINDVPAGTQFGSETLQARMITVGFNFGAMVSNDGNNLTSAGLTIWRNAIYSLAGLTVPDKPIVIVGIKSSSNGNIPSVYTLDQNYPNPFNPTTTIKFSLPKNSNVKLAVYDILGRLVTKLVDGNLQAGYHTVQFNASNLASGVYFYRIEAGNFVQVKKLMLLK